MIKSLMCLLCLALLSAYISQTTILSKGVVYCVGGKSSGEFIKDDIIADKLFSIDGVSIKLDSDINLEDKLNLLNAKTVHYFTDGEVENYYFFSEKVHNFELINGKKVNIHVAVKNDNVTVGSPIIYYGY